MPRIPSNTSHARIFTAISRSFISKSPPGFFVVISLAHNFFGHSKRQIIGPSASFTGRQPPPIPSPYESTQPSNLRSPMTNSFAVVGSRAASFGSVIQSWNVYFASGKYFHRTICCFTCRILLIEVINLFPVGTAVAACRIFPIRFSNSLNNTHFVIRTIFCNSASITLCLSHSSSMHRVAPSTIQSSTSLFTPNCLRLNPTSSYISDPDRYALTPVSV